MTTKIKCKIISDVTGSNTSSMEEGLEYQLNGINGDDVISIFRISDLGLSAHGIGSTSKPICVFYKE